MFPGEKVKRKGSGRGTHGVGEKTQRRLGCENRGEGNWPEWFVF